VTFLACVRRAGFVVAFLAASPAAEAGELAFRSVEVFGPRGERSVGQVATYVAAPGERNAVDVRFADGRLVVRDAAGVRSGSRCQAVDGGVSCPVSALRSLEMRLGDGDDEFAAEGLTVAPRLPRAARAVHDGTLHSRRRPAVRAPRRRRAFRWEIDPAVWRRHACAVVGRGLTPEQWDEIVPEQDYVSVCPSR
jgi:hypothetical protein